MPAPNDALGRLRRLLQREPIFSAYSLLVIGACAAAFIVPAVRATGGLYPAPLDDVYIYFDYARSIALGYPFEWLPGNGYSSGSTSIIYPLLLAPFYAIGLRSDSLGWAALALAVLALVDLTRSLRTVTRGLGAPPWLTYAIAPLLVSVPLLDWSWFSGMETAVAAALFGRALVACSLAHHAPPHLRRSRQWRVGWWLLLLPAARPELAAVSGLLAVGVAHAAGSQSSSMALVRSGGPTVGLVFGQAAVNYLLTGEASAAGAVRKLLLSNPYTTPLQTAAETVKNGLLLQAHGLEVAFGGAGAAAILWGLTLLAALHRSSRRLGVPILLGAWAVFGLICLNGTARFQNMRYIAPVQLLLLSGAVLGAGVVAARAAGWRQALAGIGLVALLAAPLSRFPRQIEHFARSSKNIAEQQVAVGRRLRELPANAVVLVGDAGAIPYFSERSAIDGLGLGGYRGLPFARASVHGIPAIVELIERLEPSARPTVLAIYPSWFPGLAETFGERWFSVRIDDNVICGAPEKVVFTANWSLLDATPSRFEKGAVDVDIADLVDERQVDYRFPSPQGGWVVGGVRNDDGVAVYDAGRIIPGGRSDSIIVPTGQPSGSWTYRARIDGRAFDGRLVHRRNHREVAAFPLAVSERPDDEWYEVSADVGDLRPGDELAFEVIRGTAAVYRVELRLAPEGANGSLSAL